VDGHDGGCGGVREDGFDGAGREVEGEGVDVGEEGLGSGAEDGADGGEEAEGGGDDGLVGGVDLQGCEGEPKGIGTTGAADGEGHVAGLCGGGFKDADLGAEDEALGVAEVTAARTSSRMAA
jgi:hypothetical protein